LNWQSGENIMSIIFNIETVTTMTTLSCVIAPIIAGLIGASLSTRKK